MWEASVVNVGSFSGECGEASVVNVGSFSVEYGEFQCIGECGEFQR